jgi:hypothetical protein
MTKALVRTQIRLQQLVARGEAGQGTLEYVGMIIVAAIIVVTVITMAKGLDLGGKFSENVHKVLDMG